jgi:hypothetical protein
VDEAPSDPEGVLVGVVVGVIVDLVVDEVLVEIDVGGVYELEEVLMGFVDAELVVTWMGVIAVSIYSRVLSY